MEQLTASIVNVVTTLAVTKTESGHFFRVASSLRR